MSLLSETRAAYARINRECRGATERLIRKRIYIDIRRVELYRGRYALEELDMKASQIGALGLAIFGIIIMIMGYEMRFAFASCAISLMLAIRWVAKMAFLKIRLSREMAKTRHALAIAKKTHIPDDLKFWLEGAEMLDVTGKDAGI